MSYKRYHTVKIYVTPRSKLCELAKQYFRMHGIDFEECDISKDDDARERIHELSEQQITPVVDFDGRMIVGYKPDIYDLLLAGEDEGNVQIEGSQITS